MQYVRLLLIICLGLLAANGQAGFEQLDNQQVQEKLTHGIPIIDIRRPEEWKQTGIVEGSHLITFFDKKGNYDVQKWLNQLEKIAGKNDEFILICRTGNRTGMVGKFLDKKLGFKKVAHATRGITAWIRSGHKVTKP